MSPKCSAARSAQPPAASSAAQPATNSAGRLYDSPKAHITEKPALSGIYKIHAYNVGWLYADKKRTAEQLSREVSRLWVDHRFHAIGISEVFEIDYSNKLLLEKVNVRRQEILSEVLTKLKAVASRAEQPDAGEWRGRQDAHCFYIWHASLNLISSDYVSLNVATQPWRKSQYFCFHPPDCKWPLHVYHCHCPSAGKKRKCHDRRFNKQARITTVNSMLQHALQQHRLRQQAGVEQPAFPAVLVTGDWNMQKN